MATTEPVNSMSYAGKPVVLDVIRTARKEFYGLIDDPANWTVQTRCTDWEVRDLVGHMIDVTEGYLDRWEAARKGENREVVGLLVTTLAREVINPADLERLKSDNVILVDERGLGRLLALARGGSSLGEALEVLEVLASEQNLPYRRFAPRAESA